MLQTKRISNLKVSIIIPCYNAGDLVRRNLPKIIETLNYKKNQIKEVILVDDASSDRSSVFIEKEFPKIKLIHHKVNRGFLASVNTGARAAKGNLLAFLNTDIVPEKDFLASVLRRFNNPKVFAVSLNGTGLAWIRAYFKEGLPVCEPGDANKKVRETFFVPGEGGVFRRDYWMALGGMDERLFGPFHWADIDISYRAAKRGFINLWDPDALVTHKHESAKSKLTKEYMERIRERNELLFVWKNISSPILFKKHLIGLVQKTFAHPGYLRIVLMALMRLKILIKARSREIKESRLSDEAVFAKYSKV